MADINTLFELVKELDRGRILIRFRGNTKLYTFPELRVVQNDLLPKAFIRGLMATHESFALTAGASAWLHEEKKKRKRKAYRAL